MLENFTNKRGVALPMAIFLAAGCGGEGDAGGSQPDAGSGAEEAAVSPVDAATAGNIAGTITFSGMVPEMEAIDMSERPADGSAHEIRSSHPGSRCGEHNSSLSRL